MAEGPDGRAEADAWLLKELMRLLLLHPSYCQDMRGQLSDSWALPLRLQRVIIIPGLAFTWMRRLGPLIRPPTIEDWAALDGDLWIGDLLTDPAKFTPGQAVHVGSRLLVERGVASEGEQMLFWRYRPQRYGRITIRGPHGKPVQRRVEQEHQRTKH